MLKCSKIWPLYLDCNHCASTGVLTYSCSRKRL